MRRHLVIVAAFPILALALSSHADGVKNVILMIADGQGFNHIAATNFYTGVTPVYQSFPVQLGVSTYSASNSASPGYDPLQRATNFNYVKSGYTDSSSAATAMYTGTKIYDGDINMTATPTQAPLTTFFEYAARSPYNKSMGAVSSVQISHATPATVYGHNVGRDNYAELANEGIKGSNPITNNAHYNALNYNGNFKVLMGAGHGDYNNYGQYSTSATDNYVGGATTWAQIKNGTTGNGWTFVDSKSRFAEIAAGTNVPDKLLGIAQVNESLQYKRSGTGMGNLLTNVPTLATMATAALNVLNKNTSGFTVMIEGGAIDSASHNVNLGRMIEEEIDFNNSVQAVVTWVETHSNWNETLLIVTADHETGYLLGPTNPTSFFDVNKNGIYDHGIDYGHIKNLGVGTLPGATWNNGSDTYVNHTNSLVPLFAKGAGSELFYNYIAGTDPNLAAYHNLSSSIWTGRYVDNTSIYSVMNASLTLPIPEPASLLLLSLGIPLLLARRKPAV